MKRIHRKAVALSFLVLLIGSAAKAAGPLPPVLDPSALDRSVDPCNDFYRFSCGMWLKENPIPSDQSSWYRTSDLDEHTLDVLRSILAEAAAEKDQTSPDARKIGDYYAACMDEPAIEGKGATPLKPELDRIDALKDKQSLAGAIAHLQEIGAGPLFSFGSTQDFNDATRMIANADQGGLSLPDRDYYLSDDYKDDREAFRVHVAKMFGLLGDAPAKSSSEADAVLAIETALAKVTMGRVERREPKNVHHKMTLKDWTALTPSFDWAAFINEVKSPAFDGLDVSDPGFFKGLEPVLKAFSLDDWKTYLRWNAVHALASALPAAFVTEEFNFYGKRLRGQQEQKPRWKRCVASADASLGEALGRVYVEREFGPQAKQRVLDMVGRIETVMGDDIRQSPWMGEKTKKLALDKLASVASKIGYPDKWRDYSKLTITADDAFGNQERADVFESDRELAKVGKPVDRQEWFMTPPTDNAYYDPQMNDINFPAGILQPPNFDVKADTAAVLGDIGATIGHELTHGFDDEGRHYDAHGNLVDWWTEDDSKAFEARAQGFIDEYSKFVTVKDSTDAAKDVRLDGKLTLGENIADNGGLVLAYKVLEAILASQTLKPLDGFTPEQRFFVSYGQSWCVNQTEASMREAAKVDPHSTGEYRVNGVVSNMPEFGKAFACTPGSPMMPLKMNRVW